MTPQEFDAFLQQTLADRRFSGGEKSAFAQLLAEETADDNKLASYRSKAFAAARAELSNPDAVAVLTWLEEVVKGLQPKPAPRTEAVAEAHFAPGDDCWKTIVRHLTKSRRRADLCVFTITDDRITSAILDAHRRDVAVRIITDNEKAFDPGSDVERLREAGIPLRIDQTPYHMHHKYAVFDGGLLLSGSYNWTRSAAENNEENLIVTSEARLVRTFTEAFEELWGRLA